MWFLGEFFDFGGNIFAEGWFKPYYFSLMLTILDG